MFKNHPNFPQNVFGTPWSFLNFPNQFFLDFWKNIRKHIFTFCFNSRVFSATFETEISIDLIFAHMGLRKNRLGDSVRIFGVPRKILGKVWMIFEQNLKKFEFCALCRCATAYFTLLWPILHISFKSSRKYTGIEKNAKMCFQNFSKN